MAFVFNKKTHVAACNDPEKQNLTFFFSRNTNCAMVNCFLLHWFLTFNHISHVHVTHFADFIHIHENVVIIRVNCSLLNNQTWKKRDFNS